LRLEEYKAETFTSEFSGFFPFWHEKLSLQIEGQLDPSLLLLISVWLAGTVFSLALVVILFVHT